MKKKLLATGVAVALGALSGLASAAVGVQANGIGQINILPYYSVQEGNDTLISITNTDTVNGKAVKVRFRGAEWSDDVFDFQVFLSPGDMWTGAITKEGTLAKLSTSDTSCTLPASVNQQFVPIRLQAGAQATGTLEGYVEIITMANIPPLNAGPGGAANWQTGAGGAATQNLYNAIKHVSNAAPACRTIPAAQQVLERLEQDNRETAFVAPGTIFGNTQLPTWLEAPTGSLTSYASIINVPTSKAFTFPAIALNEVDGANVKQYFRQSNDALAYSVLRTSDRIFDAALPAASPAAFGGAGLTMYQFDMPDLSTPTAVVGTTADAVAQRNGLALALTRATATTEYVTNDSLLAATDVVLSQPARRYFYEYANVTGVMPALPAHLTLNNASFQVRGEQGTVYGVLDGATNRLPVAAPTFYDREENTAVAASNIVISPTPPAAVGSFSLKGEVSVLSINGGGSTVTPALNASLTINDYTATNNIADGWATFSTTSQPRVAIPAVAGNGALPVIGFTAINLYNASAGANGTNYGMVLPLK